MKSAVIIITLLLYGIIGFSQTQNDSIFYYQQLPENPKEYTPGAVVARMIDGLGFRYYWATEGLTETDLDYRPSPEARTLLETLDHIYGLSKTIINSAKEVSTDFTLKDSTAGYEEKRNATLENFRTASALFLKTQDLSKHSIIFKRESGSSEFPFWNHINGPIEDAVWHAGQVVVLRRSSGNPMNPKVNVFLGKLND